MQERSQGCKNKSNQPTLRDKLLQERSQDCYASLLSRQERASVHGDLTCPECACIASNIILHKPIRLDDGSPYQRRNVAQVVLGRSEGHECTICWEIPNLRDTDLETVDTTLPCRNVFFFSCLSRHKNTRLAQELDFNCPNCRYVGTDIIHHVRRPSIEVELITHEPTGCCGWAMDTISSTGIGNQHEERCVCPFVPKRLKICHHEGCTKKVHRRCQEDWLERHCYKWTPEDKSFCREHNEHYMRWVCFKVGDIPLSEIGCVEGLFLNPPQELEAQEHE